MILLWGLSGDEPLEAVAQALRRRGAPVVFLDQWDAPSIEIETAFGPDTAWLVRTPAAAVDLNAVTAVYLRVYDTRRLPAMQRAGAGSRLWAHALAVESALYAWVELTAALVLNRPSAMASNNSKPYQATLIRAAGFAVPATLITTCPRAAKEFWTRYGTIIYKSVSSVRSIVARLSPADEARLADIVWCPTQFQQYVPGRDFRVHVVGEELFPCEVISTADDYRYASRQGAKVELRSCVLPDEVSARVRALSKALDLPFAGVDLRRTPDGDWYCFEVNPSPGFTFYEPESAQPVAEAVAGLLMSGGGRDGHMRAPDRSGGGVQDECIAARR